MRNVRGEAFYTTKLGRTANKVDAPAVTALIQQLDQKNHYLIARFSPLRDRWYILEDERTRVPYGLPVAGGNGSLWEDVSIRGLSHYWLNPASTGAQHHIVDIVTELREMGFDEVVFSDFRFPNTDKIRFDGDKLTALTECAAKLVKTCATDTFCVSFSRVEPDLSLPAGRTRLYLSGVSGMDIADVAGMTGFADPTIQLVFQTDSGDARFDEYCVLRPLEMMQ
jgi:hypothetical protein